MKENWYALVLCLCKEISVDKDIQQAKEEIIINKEFAWQEEWKKQWIKDHKDWDHKHSVPNSVVPHAPKEVTEVKAWFTAQWDTGFACVAMDELMKLPKKQRDKILKLGGI